MARQAPGPSQDAEPVECTLAARVSRSARLPVLWARCDPTAGRYVAHAWIGGELLPHGSECNVWPAEPCLSRTTASGAGLREAICGVRSSFTVTAHDSYGNSMREGGLRWRVNFEPEGAYAALLASQPHAAFSRGALTRNDGQVSIRDGKDGTYTVSYTLSLAGRYAVRVAAEEGGALAFATSLNVIPAPLEPSACAASVPEHAVAGEFAFGLIEARDELGNVLPAGSLHDGLSARLVPQRGEEGGEGGEGWRGRRGRRRAAEWGGPGGHGRV